MGVSVEGFVPQKDDAPADVVVKVISGTQSKYERALNEALEEGWKMDPNHRWAVKHNGVIPTFHIMLFKWRAG